MQEKIKITYPQNVELTREQLYWHTVARGTSLKNLDDGTLIKVDEIVAYDDLENNSKIISILGHVWNKEREQFEAARSHFASNSGILREDLAKIVEIFGSTGITIRIIKNVSKAGRTFVTCELA